jgi:L-idonate 5-dehydrogenase
MSPDTLLDPDHGRPLRLRCLCLVIHAPDDLRVLEQDAGELASGQVLCAMLRLAR